jgi:tetratricopeptide (TPR) repeat protein
MADNNSHQSGSDIPPKETPAQIFGMGDIQAQKVKHQQQTKILWGIFSLLLVLVLSVFFILPRYISRPVAADIAPVIIPLERSTSQEAFSPFGEAQLLREREQAQEILAQILELQEQLEDISVESWAEDAYLDALAIAAEGDAAYRDQNFLGAQEIYQRGLLSLQALDTLSLEVLNSSLEKGYAAIESGLPAEAEEAFTTALLIEADSETALVGLERAGLLPEVMALIEQGNSRGAANDLEAALVFYTQAVSVDPAHTGAAEAIAQTNIDILERDFLNNMSAGFSAIQNNNPESALLSFNQALALRPQSADALAAITQAETMITSRDLNIQLSAAREHEAAERWQEALQAYNNAIAIDANVVAATNGLENAQRRNNLDIFLNNIINAPLRLADDAVYQQSITVYNQALPLAQQNTRLYQQLLTLRNFLDQARVPVPVTMISDGITNVTIFRVNELGAFQTQTLNLNPGNYTAVGVRSGYRDVRVEFAVPFSGEEPAITVICNEPV